jgi:putative Holliday junction resolvase
MAVQSMLDNRLKKKKKTRQNKALIEISATIMLQDYLNRKYFKQ